MKNNSTELKADVVIIGAGPTGLTAAHDTLPPRFTEDPMPAGPSKGKVYDILDPMKEAWYTVQGWNPKTGIPKRERLEELKVVVDELE